MRTYWITNWVQRGDTTLTKIFDDTEGPITDID